MRKGEAEAAEGCVDCQRKRKKRGLDCVAQELIFQVNIVRNALRALAAAFTDLIDTISPLHLFTFSLLCLVYLALHFLFVLNLLCSLLR